MRCLILEHVDVRNAREALDALISALRMSFGTLTINVSDGVPTLLRYTHTITPTELEKLKVA